MQIKKNRINYNYFLTRRGIFLFLLLIVNSVLTYFNLMGLSLSFIFGLLFLINIREKISLFKLNGKTKLLVWFYIINLISFAFSPLSIEYRNFYMQVQTLYWLLLAIVISNLLYRINLNTLSKYLLFSAIILIVLYDVPKFLVYDGEEGITIFGVSQNTASFTLVMLWPLAFYYFKKSYIRILMGFIFIILVLLNGSRTGGVIVLLQFVLLIIVYDEKLKRYFYGILFGLIILGFSLNTEYFRTIIGGAIEPYNKELAVLIIDPDYVNRNDKSWIQRKLMVQKGLQIFDEYPILGVGPYNFPRYRVDWDLSQIQSDIDVTSLIEKSTVINSSSHNAYIAILSEFGILGFFLWVLFLLKCLVGFLRRRRYFGNTFQTSMFVSLVGILIYFYTISIYVGTLIWLFYGMIAGSSEFRKRSSLVQSNGEERST